MLSHSNMDRVRKLANRIRELEDKLMKSSLMSMAEQQVIHAEIRKCKDELDMLEKRTR